MRRLAVSLFVVGFMLALSVGVPSVSADNGPHVKGMGGMLTSNCAGCHRAHTGQAADLLKASSVEALCYTCHGSAAGGSSLDVRDGVGYPEAGESGKEDSTERPEGDVKALRGGGFKYAMIETNTEKAEYEGGIKSETQEAFEAIGSNKRLVSGEIPTASSGREVTSSHSTNGSPQIAWGNGAIDASTTEWKNESEAERKASYGATVELTCASCHNPHGDGDYRILKGLPGGGEGNTYNTTEVNITEPSSPNNPKQYTTSNYWETWEPYNKNFRYRISEWCSTCHTRLLTTGSTATTPSGDAVFEYRHTTNFTQAQYEKIEKEYVSAEHPDGTKTEPNCIQCHVAHGTDATMEGWAAGVPLPNGETPTHSETGGGGESFLLRVDNRGTCQMCHYTSVG